MNSSIPIGDGRAPVLVKDPTDWPVGLNFIRPLGAQTQLKEVANPDTYTIEVDNTTGFVNNNYLGIFCPTGEYCFAEQYGAPAGDVITINTPLQCSFPVDCNVLNFTREMAVDGTAGPGGRTVFQVGPVGAGAGVTVEITRILGVILDNLAMDDSKFGGISELAKGCILRKNNGQYFNYSTFKTNGELAISSGKPMSYTDKGGAGAYSAAFCLSIAGQGNHGVAIRLEPGDILEMIIQDDLSDLLSFKMMAQGHIARD